MHIPDAVLSVPVAAATSVLGASGLAVALRQSRSLHRDRTSVLMGSMAAFVFAAQMVNFPLIPLPISGHLLGGVLTAVLLGPWAGAVVIAAVLLVQCFLFGDGGLTALGANFLNMGLIGSVGGYLIYAGLRRALGGPAGVILGAMAAAWFSVLLASGAFAVELTLSQRGPGFLPVLGWMALVHSAIGLGEAIITGAVLRFVMLIRPDIVPDVDPSQDNRAGRYGSVLGAGLAIALAVATFLAPFASEFDDGLEWVGKRHGFLGESEPVVEAPIPDYRIGPLSLNHPRLATAVAGAVGTLVVLGLGLVLGRGVARGEPSLGLGVAHGESSRLDSPSE